ncbi:hypothetical protein ABBQ38_005688 [Trebouxia sp. C0009 RCD-2024]
MRFVNWSSRRIAWTVMRLWDLPVLSNTRKSRRKRRQSRLSKKQACWGLCSLTSSPWRTSSSAQRSAKPGCL